MSTALEAWKNYHYCPKCGDKISRQFEQPENPFVCKKCGFTQYFNPSIGVVGILVNKLNQCLLLERGKEPAKGKFGLPGGFADFNESAEMGLKREILEETSLEAKSFEYLYSDTNLYPYKSVLYHVIDIFFVCYFESFEGIKIDESEVSGYLITVPGNDHLENMAFSSNRKALEFYYGAS